MKLLSVATGLSFVLNFLKLNVLSYYYVDEAVFVLIQPSSQILNNVQEQLPPDGWKDLDVEYGVLPEVVCERIKNAQIVVNAEVTANNTSLKLTPSSEESDSDTMLLHYDNEMTKEVDTLFCESDDDKETYVAENNDNVIVLRINKFINIVTVGFLKKLSSYIDTGNFLYNYYRTGLIAADNHLQRFLKITTSCLSFFQSLSSSAFENHDIYVIFLNNLRANNQQLQMQCSGHPYHDDPISAIQYRIQINPAWNYFVKLTIATNQGVTMETYLIPNSSPSASSSSSSNVGPSS